jgi:hypothetical protein
VVSNPAKRQQVPKPPPKPPEVPRIVRLLQQARAWRALIDGGEASCAAAIAERSGLSAVYVRNILFLLRLHPAIQAAIETLPVGAGDHVNERWLRPITRLPAERQLAVAAERLTLALDIEECG